MSAKFQYPNDLVFDENGNLFIADTFNSCIRRIAVADGTVSTFAGICGSAGNSNGFRTSATFGMASGLFYRQIDKSLYVTDESFHTVRRIDSSGTVTTIAGSGGPGDLDSIGTWAQFNTPTGILVLSDGTIYIADNRNHKIKKISPTNYEVTTFAGSSAGSYDANGRSAKFNNPCGIVLSSTGTLIVSDESGSLIREIDSAANVKTIAFNGVDGMSNGPALRSGILRPRYIDIDAATGTVFIPDPDNHNIRALYDKQNISQGAFWASDSWDCITGYCVETFAGNGWGGYLEPGYQLGVSNPQLYLRMFSQLILDRT